LRGGAFVIPGHAEGVDPESRSNHGLRVWIPGSLAELVIGPAFGRTRWLAPGKTE
jgi:hypothetical protein